MNSLFKITVAAALLCYALAAETHLFQQTELPDDSSINVVGVGCFCIKSNDSLSIGSQPANLLDCFCMNNFDELPVNNNTDQDSFNRWINPYLDLSNQASLVCTCAFPKSANVSRSNPSFLLPQFNGTANVPVNCTCARALDYIPSILPPVITIPILNIDIPIPFSDANRTFEYLIPIGCSCSSRLDLLSGVNIFGYSPNLPALFCKCLPPINASSGDLAILGSDFTVPIQPVNIPALNLTFNGFDASTVLGNLTVGSLPAGITFPNNSFTIPYLDITITPPPYIRFGPSQQGNQPQGHKNNRVRLY